MTQPFSENVTHVIDSSPAGRPIGMPLCALRFLGCARDLERMRTHMRDWGKPGAENPSDETIDYAYEIISDLIRGADTRGVVLPEPAVGRCSDGAVLFEWDLEGKSFELELVKRKGAECMSCLLCPIEEDEMSWREEDIIGPICLNPAVLTFLSWLPGH